MIIGHKLDFQDLILGACEKFRHKRNKDPAFVQFLLCLRKHKKHEIRNTKLYSMLEYFAMETRREGDFPEQRGWDVILHRAVRKTP